VFFAFSAKKIFSFPIAPICTNYLANELKVNHVLVSSVYAAVQLTINMILIYWVDIEQIGYGEALVFVGICCVIYLILRRQVLGTI